MATMPKHALVRSRLFPLLLGFGLYVGAGELGLSAPFTSGNVSPFWPAAGIALAGVLVWGYWIWPGIAAAAFLVNFWSPIPAQAAFGIAVGNTSAALVGGFLLRRIAQVRGDLDRVRDVAALILFGALLSPMVAATIGTLTLLATHVKAWSGSGITWTVWCFGDGMGVLIAGPLLIGTRHARATLREFRSAEAVGLLAGTALVSLLVFSHPLIQDDVLAFAVFPFVIWAAIRFRTVGVSVVCLMIAMIAVWGTAHGDGPFVKHGPLHNAAALQLFLALISVSGLCLAAVIVERKQTEDTLRNLSGRLLQLQDEERRRLARELHDSSGQSLVALQMNLSALSQRATQTDKEISRLIVDSQAILRQVVTEIRTLSHLLYPPLLDEGGLPVALQCYVEGLSQRSHLKIDLRTSSEFGRLDRELETTIFRIVQECLTNIHRHSGSSMASIALARDGGRIMLTIRDEGKGIDWELGGVREPLPPGLGVGLRGIAERVRELHGEFRMRSASPGTLVQVTLPVQG